MPTLAIYNPTCGDRTAKDFFQEHVLPFLDSQDKPIVELIETRFAGHAGQAVSEFLAQSSSSGDSEPVTIVLGSGDGTLHEIINDVYFRSRGKDVASRINIVPVPCGTANALYSSLFPPPSPDSGKDTSYRLQALEAFAAGRPVIPLSLAITILNGSEDARPLVSSVVVSTALHAAILRDSESLRDQHPGIERFKIAAEQNSSNWYRGRVRLYPVSEGAPAQIYKPATNSFDRYEASAVGTDGVVELEGPFAYFLSTINVDRLEPAFSITPLSRTIPPPPGSCDIVIVRPLRDPLISSDSPEARGSFVPKLWAVMGGAYRDGAHIKLRYGENGEVGQGGDGLPVVEYVRCGGWQWLPESGDENAHLLCSDGAISYIKPGGNAECRVSMQAANTTFAVYYA